ncbi:NAD-dependent deacetylase sirtuin-2 [Dendrothele bispora CBS 962.96]|uniref:NAD-dependent protein deacetylase n=1 Tax=Dendrothele bispora (strain CBS 962.96) TaxID=1314807 RepID=A0A4S8M4J2_DENBC|nr:NAD-dependent deacetylase sirtuin-2 [Dendrothele bispora CBS 962.96]
MSDNAEIKELANFIRDKCKNIVLMLGAGVSTAAGIPDFRSPKTGLYANLARLNLPYPEAVFDIQFFLKNPVPFYTLAHELYPGKFRPTLTHSFIRLLHSHNLLSLCCTQNIDTLERRAGVPSEKIVEAHGSFATQRCVRCRTPFDDAKMKDFVMNYAQKKLIPRCGKKGCGGLIKPDIVFFGESLPPSFFSSQSVVSKADLILVIGTSLTVQPFASLSLYPVPRALINLDLVGDFGMRESDEEREFILLGQCDDIVRELCRELGWEEELMKLWEETKDSVEGESEEGKKDREEKKNLQAAEDEVAKLTKSLGEQLVLDRAAGDIAKKESGAEAKAEAEGEGGGTAKATEKIEEKIEKGKPVDASTEVKDEKGQEKSEEKKGIEPQRL